MEENEYLFDLASKEDWVYQWVVIDPRQPETYRQAEKMLKVSKTLGIKIHPSSHGYDIREYGDALFAFAAEHKAFVLMHPQHIGAMPYFADKYPDMNLILAHLGSLAHVDAIAAAKYGNIYTDTYSCAFQYGRIALSTLSEEDKSNILYKNALRHFPAAFKK